MRDSVLLNFWDSFLVTLPSFSSKTFLINSLLILRTDVFPDWPFLGCYSCVFNVWAANFRLFLNFVISLKGKCNTDIKTELVFICYSTWDYNKKWYSLEQTNSQVQYSQLIIKVINRIYLPSTSISPIYTSSWLETKIFTSQVKVQSREKYFNHSNYKEKMPTMAGNKRLSVHFFLYRQRLFHLSTENIRVWLVENGCQNAYSRADTMMNNDINKLSERFSLKTKYWKMHQN